MNVRDDTVDAKARADRAAATMCLAAATLGVLVANGVELASGTWSWPDAIGPVVLGGGLVWILFTRRVNRR
ncbi:MAG: hypothetical protein SFY69_12620 [Planctomycetota bacterium]|nr:hypothetical protein [Planctomycetota bacterium]